MGDIDVAGPLRTKRGKKDKPNTTYVQSIPGGPRTAKYVPALAAVHKSLWDAKRVYEVRLAKRERDE